MEIKIMKLYEFTDDISDEDRLERMESYLDEMISLTDDLIKENVKNTEHRPENTQIIS